MSTGEIIIVVLIVLYIFLESYLKKKAENRADIQDSREISYESKKGENLATKEDIKEITDLVESIKNDVAFESQRRHDFIEQRTELFLSILKYAEEIDQCGLLMNYYVDGGNADEKIDALIQQVKDIMTAVGYNRNLIIASEKNLNTEDIKPLTELTHVILLYGAEICEYGSRAMQILSSEKRYIDLYTKCNQDQNIMKLVEFTREQLTVLQKEERPKSKYQNELTDKNMKYLEHLYKLFHKDFNIYLNYNQPTK